jgi:hypothetical protein
MGDAVILAEINEEIVNNSRDVPKYIWLKSITKSVLYPWDRR